MLEDATKLEEEKPGDIVDLLRQRQIPWVIYDEWSRLDEHEIELGKPQGRPRVKLRRVEEMLAKLGVE